MKKSTSQIATVSVAVLLVLGGGGCASPPTVAEFYQRESKRLNPPERRLLVETLRVFLLLEEYRAALEAKEMDEVIACYSPHYSHYEKGLDWLKDRIRERFFDPFGELSVSLRDLSIEFVQKDTGYWLRQDDFDWLRALGDRSAPGLPVFIKVYAGSGPLEMVLGESPSSLTSYARSTAPLHSPGRESDEGGNSSDKGLEAGPRVVTVRSSVDPGVECPLGEVSFRLLVKGRLAGCCGSEVFTSLLEEKVILLLEKEDDGNWKIISQW